MMYANSSIIDYIHTIDFPVHIIQSFKHNTHPIDCEISEYEVISKIVKQYPFKYAIQ